jgi:hypothetical protein
MSPEVNRLVSIRLVKDPEIDLHKIRTVGVLPFKSPDSNLGRQLASDMVQRLTRDFVEAKVVQVYQESFDDISHLRVLGKGAGVDGLLIGEITEYSVQAREEKLSILAFPDYDAQKPQDLAWVGVTENPTIGDQFYYRLRLREEPRTVQVLATSVTYALTVHFRLMEVGSGHIVWQESLAKRRESLRLPGRQVDTNDVGSDIRASIIEEVIARLEPQESSVQRMLRGPRMTMEPEVAKLVRQGIEAASFDDWKKAERLFTQAQQLAPKECLIIGNLGVVHERNGKFQEAVAAYERAYNCQPLDPTYRYYSNDLQTAFAPDLQKEDLPILVLAVRGDGIIYIDGGKDLQHHLGDFFNVAKVETSSDRGPGEIRAVREVEFARGEIIEVRQGMSLGRILWLDPERQVRKGDLVRFDHK